MIAAIYENSVDGQIGAEYKWFFDEQPPVEWMWERILFCVHEGRLLLNDVLGMSLPRLGTTIRIVKKYRASPDDALDD